MTLTLGLLLVPLLLRAARPAAGQEAVQASKRVWAYEIPNRKRPK